MSEVASKPALGLAELLARALRLLLRLLWYGVIPLLLSGLIWRYLLPHASAATGRERVFGIASGRSLQLTLALFVALSAMLRYWRNWLPGGRYLSSLPDRFLQRVPRRRIAVCEAAFALLDMLARPDGARRIAASRYDVEAARVDLAAVLEAGKWSEVFLARERLAAICGSLGRPSHIYNSLPLLALVGVSALLALQMRARFLQTYDVLGSSMLPTLTPGEVLAGRVAEYGPGRLPRRGEVVVLQTLIDGVPREVVKRVIGLPGDHIAMNGVHPIINGWPVPVCQAGAYYSPNEEASQTSDPSGLLVMEFLEGEAYLTLQATLASPVAEYVVKRDEIYVLGDNRSHSRDSRSSSRGAPRGFPLQDVKATIARTLFRPTARGDIDLRAALEPLGPSAYLDGADVSGTQARISACLAMRPKFATPPRAASAALARHP